MATKDIKLPTKETKKGRRKTYRERRAACLWKLVLVPRCQLYNDKFHLIDGQRDPVLTMDLQPIVGNRVKVPMEIEITGDATFASNTN